MGFTPPFIISLQICMIRTHVKERQGLLEAMSISAKFLHFRVILCEAMLRR